MPASLSVNNWSIISILVCFLYDSSTKAASVTWKFPMIYLRRKIDDPSFTIEDRMFILCFMPPIAAALLSELSIPA